MRDIFTHKLTTPEHWNMLMVPTAHDKDDLDYDLFHGGEDVVRRSYDPHCADGEVTDGCAPVAVISAEKLRDYAEGPAETTRIANALRRDGRMGQYVIAPEAWDCVWAELIQRGKGLKTVYDRPGFGEELLHCHYTSLLLRVVSCVFVLACALLCSVESDYNFSAEMLEQMIKELDRLIAKYSSDAWNTRETANRIVDLLVEHRALIQVELNEIMTGVRKLTARDFLGPKERRRRLQVKNETVTEQKDYFEYFNKLDRERDKRRRARVAERQGAQRAARAEARAVP